MSSVGNRQLLIERSCRTGHEVRSHLSPWMARESQGLDKPNRKKCPQSVLTNRYCMHWQSSVVLGAWNGNVCVLESALIAPFSDQFQQSLVTHEGYLDRVGSLQICELFCEHACMLFILRKIHQPIHHLSVLHH